MDAFMCGLQIASAKTTALRFCSLSVRLGMVGSHEASAWYARSGYGENH